jgi:hypothetical protein
LVSKQASKQAYLSRDVVRGKGLFPRGRDLAGVVKETARPGRRSRGAQGAGEFGDGRRESR